MTSLVVGGSSGLGRAIATRLAASGHGVFLVSSDARDLEPLARDLALRFDVTVGYLEVDLRKPDVDVLKARVVELFDSGLDNLFYVAGYGRPDYDSGPVADDFAEAVASVNYTSGVRIVNAFLEDLREREGANLVGIGSAAADRPRRMNSIYGSAKRGFESYFGALRHYLSPYPCAVQFYRAGYLDTRMTFGRALPLPKMDPDVAARKVVSNLGSDTGVRYVPWWWWIVMTVYQLVPWFLFKRLNG